MKMYTEESCRPKYLTIHESELRIKAGISALWGEREIETGGEMFGLWTHGGRPIIFLGTGPGPKAIHEPTYFEQDIDFFHRVHGIIAAKYGAQVLGSHHCHHFLGILGPSSGDVCQVQGITRRNNFTKWCEIITTCENCDDISQGGTHHLPKASSSQNHIRIRVKAYLYTDTQSGQKVEIPIRVLPGISPFRLHALADVILKPADIGEYACGFPMERIIYDSFDSKDEPFAETEPIIQVLQSQCQELPRKAQNDISFRIEEDRVIAILALPGFDTAYVSYNNRPPHLIQAVHVKNEVNGKIASEMGLLPADGQDISLNDVYKMLMSRKQRDPNSHLLRGRLWGCINRFAGLSKNVELSDTKPDNERARKHVEQKAN